MKARIFAELPAITNLEVVNLPAGTRFLTGRQMMAQQETKKVGDEITYYIVTESDKDGKNISYKPIYDKMEE